MKILIVEDEEHILSFLTRGFREDGHLVESSMDGEEGEYMSSTNRYDIIILDWMLPGKNGLEILHSLRNKQIKTPVIMLTAKGETEEKVAVLTAGADDYLVKPFAYEELLARVGALYRRSAMEGSNTISIQDITLDLDAKTVYKEGETITLSQKEFELLLFLVKHKNNMVTNAMIEEQLWSSDTVINSNVIQVTVYHLRKKIGKHLIKSFRGLGYKIESQ
ncbi:response regulator transcription factor [Sulfurovum sp. ST-21]|uniref:Response regulator transcription factor n=1 Tax=Sulfurovum indicum TaxID=2779528 RepID=A0A7M1S199_9BACT|nr:response regulator transcription factor [Sulfurovum indicum]QOR61243.1 response regulator transcription factor [Sulfurovum indicum]